MDDVPEIMLTYHERIEIIRQAEKSNLSNKDTKQLLEWAEHTRLAGTVLETILKGYVDVAKIKNGEPMFSLTDIGRQYLEDMPFEE